MKSLSLYDLEKRKMDKPIVEDITIESGKWTFNSSINKYIYKHENENITSKDTVNLDIDDINIMNNIKDSYIDSIVKEYDGYFEIYAANKPTVDISCKMTIIKEDN